VGFVPEIVFAKPLTCVKAPPIGSCETGGMKEKPLIEAGEQKILSLTEETKFAENGIVSRTVFRSPSFRVVLFGFAAGQELSEHTSTQHALVQILSGECEFSLAGQPHQLKAGDLLYMPPNLPHACCATQPFSMLLTLSPAALLPENVASAKVFSPVTA
jgi:quercetin dioxygenase-like cupin family protein